MNFVNTFVDVTEQDCIAQFSSISFDAFVFELWVALSYGASMCIVDSETLFHKNRFYETVTENKISIAFITTPLINNEILDNFISLTSFRRLYSSDMPSFPPKGTPADIRREGNLDGLEKPE
ncbi:AMP-binding protein [Photorhabdus thracensis]|uniref:AMP-binding protein n=1 Tax=Photorhabdus thracensis TaxID=230089 RepID=UPI0013010C3F|nr:AMP-binding protein [Photorhabdus thracensis]